MEDKFKQINIENNIIYIYFILLFLYLYGNQLEINYLKYGDVTDKENYRIILFIVFGISLIITIYYVIDSYKNLYNNNQELTELSFISSILILLANIIILYVIYKDENIDLEISP